MTVVALGSARGAPGVTTTALVLAAAVPAVLVEADLSGGVLAARYGLGREPGLTTLVAAARGGAPVDWRDHAQSAGGVPTLVGPDSAEVARSLWHRAGDRAATILAGLGLSVVVDLGRVAVPTPMAGAIDVAVLVVSPRSDQLISASYRLDELRQAAGSVGVVVVGDGPYRPVQVAESLGVGLLGVVPDDPRAAAVLEGTAGHGRSFARSRLARSGVTLATSIGSAVGGVQLPAATA